MWFIEFIRNERDGLMRAPFTFLTVLIGGLVLGFAGGMAWRAQEVANAESLGRVKDEERQYSERQLSDIKTNLKINPATVDIGGGHTDKPDPRVEQLKDAFKDSGWDVGAMKSQFATSDLVLSAPDPKAANTIEKALKDAGVTYQTAKPSTTGGTDFFLGPAK
ncbi:hypothetical protein GCM10007881_49700 [Mesorhizobium huakuii]|uniref:hypothetical protein n=1 Tax=Mesorhizobium huakuii TaxID=28104 RepID=UPI00235D91D9|nr:hypothetical protein [Mesorhizobium huakuii]GLQ81449.1 hypothetical protein GCM10007881_49700 [Mesorhizobium huakuii]